MHISTDTCLCMRSHTVTYIHTHTHKHTHRYIHAYTNRYIPMHVLSHIHAYTHTHTHTHTYISRCLSRGKVIKKLIHRHTRYIHTAGENKGVLVIAAVEPRVAFASVVRAGNRFFHPLEERKLDMRGHVCTYVWACMYICVGVPVCVCVCVCVCACVCVRMTVIASSCHGARV